MLRCKCREARQRDLFENLLPRDLQELPEDLAKLDRWLDDERFFTPFQERYHAWLGRPSIPAETYLRMVTLQRQFGLSDRAVCAEVSDRISWRRFCRIPWGQPVPHPTSLCKIRQRLDADGGDHMAALNEYLVRKACEAGLVKARKLRVDTTAVESNIHHPTDAGLIADAVRLLTRTVKKIQGQGVEGLRFRDRTRSIRRRLLRISKVLRRRTGEAVQEVRRITGEMAGMAEQVVRAAGEVLTRCRRVRRPRIKRLAQQLATFWERATQVIRQARQVQQGNVHLPDRLVSLFDPDARPIRRGKLGKPTEFGTKLRLCESEEQVITEYAVYLGNPADHDLLEEGAREHARRTGHPPKRVATDRGFAGEDNEQALRRLGVRYVSIPVKGKRSARRTAHERQSWFRRLQRWRAGQEATISLLKRRYGLHRSRYRGLGGHRRWVGGGIWGYNLYRIARLL